MEVSGGDAVLAAWVGDELVAVVAVVVVAVVVDAADATEADDGCVGLRDGIMEAILTTGLLIASG